MRILCAFIVGLVLLGSCGKESTTVSVNPYASYFYPYDSIPKIYLFRDVAHGLDEQYHRIYGVKDSQGEHIVVEIYAADGRIIEALNYNVDSLDVIDHMVVNRVQEKTKAELFKNRLIPMDANEEAYFASRFQGFLDSTLILKEVRRKVHGSETNSTVMEVEVPAIRMDDKIRLTNFNPFTKKETVMEGKAVNVFAKGYGLVEWYTPNKKVHYRLEKIMDQQEWLKIITR
jgi:hypothetical protein